MTTPRCGSRTASLDRPFRPAHGLALALLASALWAPPAHAQSLVPADQAAATLMKALGFDKGLAKRGGGKLVVGVLVRSQADAGLTGDPLIDPPPDAPAMQEALGKLDPALARKVKVQVVPLTAATVAEAEALVADSKLSALYVDGGFTAKEAAQLAGAAEKKCIFTLYRATTYEGVFALGVMSRNGRVKLLVNLATSNACGVELDPPSLQTAIVL